MGKDFTSTRSQGPDTKRGPLHICERCGFEQFYEDELVEQEGLLVCPECYDEPDEAGNMKLIG